jgi:hypothetical protein
VEKPVPDWLQKIWPATAGIGIGILANALIVVGAVMAAALSHEIPLVVNSPSRYSVLVVPVALAAVVAASFSFLQYMRDTRILAFIGMAVAGYVTALFFFEFPAERSTLIVDYLKRLDQISIGTLLFSLLALASSIWTYLGKRRNGAIQTASAPEHYPEFWLLKGLVCDLPIVIGTCLLLYVQSTYLESSHQQYTEVLFDLIGENMKAEASPEFFQAEELQRQLGIANFWIGVSLGVTSVQLVAQQLGTLMLEVVFWRKAQKV